MTEKKKETRRGEWTIITTFARYGSDTHLESRLFASRCERKGRKNELKREKEREKKDTTRLVGEHHPDTCFPRNYDSFLGDWTLSRQGQGLA